MLVEALMVLQRHDAEDEGAAEVVRRARAVYLVGDSALHLRSVLKETPVLDAIQGVAGRRRPGDGRRLERRPRCATRCSTSAAAPSRSGSGVLRGVCVIPMAETRSHDRRARTLTLADAPVVELPTGSALVQRDDGWELVGDARSARRVAVKHVKAGSSRASCRSECGWQVGRGRQAQRRGGAVGVASGLA